MSRKGFGLLVVGLALVLGTAGRGAAGLWWLVLALPVLVALVQPVVVQVVRHVVPRLKAAALLRQRLVARLLKVGVLPLPAAAAELRQRFRRENSKKVFI